MARHAPHAQRLRSWTGALAVLLATSASVAPEAALAAAIPFSGTLSVQLTPNRMLAGPIGPVSGAGTATLAGGGSFTLPAGAFATSTSTAPGIPTGASPNSIYLISRSLVGASEPGSFQAGGGPAGGFGGLMALGFEYAEELGIVPLTLVFGKAELFMQPIGGGLFFGSEMAFCLVGPCPVVTFADGWTTGAISIAPPTRTSSRLTAVGFDHRTAGGAGHIQLVTPFVVFDSSGSSSGFAAGIATLDLQFVPEPGVPSVLALAACAAAFRGARRRR